MEEKIAEKILEEIKSLKIGQQRIVGEVEVLNSMCKKLDMGQKSLEVMQQKTAKDVEEINVKIGGMESDIVILKSNQEEMQKDISTLKSNQEDMQKDIKLLNFGQRMLMDKQDETKADIQKIMLLLKMAYDKIEVNVMDIETLDNKTAKIF